MGRLVEELEQMLYDDDPSSDGGPDQAARFAMRIAVAGRLGPEVEGPITEVHEVITRFLDRIQAVDAEIRSRIRGASLGDRLQDPATTVEEVIGHRAREVDEVVVALEQSSILLVDGMAWSMELRGAGQRLASALHHLTEASSVLHAWEQLAGGGADGHVDDPSGE